MKGSTLALLVGGGLAVGGAVYYLRKKKAAAPDKCDDLGTLDARAGALCRLGVIDAVGDAVGGLAGTITSTGNSTIGKVLGKVSGWVSSVIQGNCDENCQRRKCEQVRDTGKYGPFGGVTLSDSTIAKIRADCAAKGFGW